MVTELWSGDGRRLGVYVDEREALVIDVSGLRGSTMPAGIERIRSEAGTLDGRGGGAEGRGIRRRLQRAAYYASVVEAVEGASRVMVYGPGWEARELYRVLLEDLRFAGALQGLERTAPGASEAELVEMVRDRLGEAVMVRAGSGAGRGNF